jgi:hypothetical protein
VPDRRKRELTPEAASAMGKKSATKRRRNRRFSLTPEQKERYLRLSRLARSSEAYKAELPVIWLELFDNRRLQRLLGN